MRLGFGFEGGCARHDEELAHHARALADVLLHELGARDADEGAVGVVRHRAREQRLACVGLGLGVGLALGLGLLPG